MLIGIFKKYFPNSGVFQELHKLRMAVYEIEEDYILFNIDVQNTLYLFAYLLT